MNPKTVIPRLMVSKETRGLIRSMSTANPWWGAPRIHGELLKLGIEVSQTCVSMHTVRRRMSAPSRVLFSDSSQFRTTISSIPNPIPLSNLHQASRVRIFSPRYENARRDERRTDPALDEIDRDVQDRTPESLGGSMTACTEAGPAGHRCIFSASNKISELQNSLSVVVLLYRLIVA
jgi:hypothetical protein